MIKKLNHKKINFTWDLFQISVHPASYHPVSVPVSVEVPVPVPASDSYPASDSHPATDIHPVSATLEINF